MTAGIIRMRVLIEGGSYLRKYGIWAPIAPNLFTLWAWGGNRFIKMADGQNMMEVSMSMESFMLLYGVCT